MHLVEFQGDGSRVDTVRYSSSPETYDGQIICIECKKKSWYVKSYTYQNVERVACFGAHHLDGCDRATSILIAEGMEGAELDAEQDKNNADIHVNLDKTKHGSVEVSQPADKLHGDEHTWTVSSRPSVMGNKKGFPNNRSLRQILSYLAKNPKYGEGKSIQITADSGRELLNGMLRDHLVEIPFLKEDDFQSQKLFWGEISNFTEKPDGSLWLNYGSYAEPSLYLDKKLKEDVMRVYKLKSLERFRGSHFLVFGVIGKSPKGKPIIRAAFPKYMNFINYRLEQSDEIS